MNLAISNIAWSEQYDEYMYNKLHDMGIVGLEIAPTRIFKDTPYDHIDDAIFFANKLKTDYGLSIPSIQSIWYGRQEKIWGESCERDILTAYTKKAIDFASAIGCKNLVFGCPRNRVMPTNANLDIAINFFRELGEYAYQKNTCIGLEANPPIYNTNFINTTVDAISFITQVDSKGFRLNLDIGTMIYNNEDINILKENSHLINHVHISEPGLRIIENREVHYKIIQWLTKLNYKGHFSIEMGKTNEIDAILDRLIYLKKCEVLNE